MNIIRTTVDRTSQGGYIYTQRVYMGNRSHRTRVELTKNLEVVSGELLVFPWVNDYDVSIIKQIINGNIDSYNGYTIYRSKLPHYCIGCDIAKKYVKNYITRKSINLISKAWERAYWCPSYKVCQKRLINDWKTLTGQKE